MHKRVIRAFVAIAAAVSAYYFTQSKKEPLAVKIAVDAVKVHRANVEPEFHTISLAILQEKLSRLGFRMIASQRIIGRYSLIGGSHSEVMGKRAALIKVKSVSSGEIYSLFQLHIDPKWPRSELEGVVEVENLSTKLWVEKNLLHVLVGP